MSPVQNLKEYCPKVRTTSRGVKVAERLSRPEQAVAVPPRQTALISARLEMEIVGTSACLNT